MRRRGFEQKLVIPGAGSSATTRSTDPTLLGLVARSRHWFESIASGRVASFTEIAKAEGVSEQFVSNRISLAFLAPEIVETELSTDEQRVHRGESEECDDHDPGAHDHGNGRGTLLGRLRLP